MVDTLVKRSDFVSENALSDCNGEKLPEQERPLRNLPSSDPKKLLPYNDFSLFKNCHLTRLYCSILWFQMCFLCSYLGFGLMAGRAAVLAWEETKAANPCIPADHSGTYEYSGLSYDLISTPSGASFDSCSKLVTTVLKQDADCGAPAVSSSLFIIVAFDTLNLFFPTLQSYQPHRKVGLTM